MLRNNFLILLIILFFAQGCTKSCREQEVERDKVAVSFKSPEDESIMTAPIEVSFGVSGMKVRPALEAPTDKTSGHYTILIDHPRGFIEKGQPVPENEQSIHFAKGETSASLMLTPGVHTLTLQFADGAHLSYGKELAHTIKVTVLEFSEEDAGPD